MTTWRNIVEYLMLPFALLALAISFIIIVLTRNTEDLDDPYLTIPDDYGMETEEP